MKKALVASLYLSLLLLLGISPASAEEMPPEYKFYFPIASKAPPGDMVYIPAGPFTLGCDTENNNGIACEEWRFPLQEIYLDSFYIDRHEVTYAEYNKCVDAGACSYAYWRLLDLPEIWKDPAYANHPATVELNYALYYCEWVGKRLPREFEWEKAARGPDDTRPYPWGSTLPTCDLANFNGCVGDTTPVGSYPLGASPYGALDMAGNLTEFTDDGYCREGLQLFSPCGPLMVGRGGDWNSDEAGTIITYRYQEGTSGNYIGFRCAVSAQ
jgi:formylglycine-generating enzyme required for sulfatase activity